MNQLSEPRRIALNAFILAAIIMIYVLVMSPWVQYAVAGVNLVYRGTDRNAVALECIVNWDAAAIGPILDLLRERGARLTFFVSADWARRNPELLRRMADDTHEIGCYGDISSGSRAAFRADIVKAREAVQAACGVAPRLYMPKSEDVPDALTNAARDEKMMCVLYSVDLQSAKASSPEELVRRALKNPFGGAMVRFAPTAYQLAALPAIMDKLSENGFMLKPVGEVLGTRMI